MALSRAFLKLIAPLESVNSLIISPLLRSSVVWLIGRNWILFQFPVRWSSIFKWLRNFSGLLHLKRFASGVLWVSDHHKDVKKLEIHNHARSLDFSGSQVATKLLHHLRVFLSREHLPPSCMLIRRSLHLFFARKVRQGALGCDQNDPRKSERGMSTGWRRSARNSEREKFSLKINKKNKQKCQSECYREGSETRDNFFVFAFHFEEARKQHKNSRKEWRKKRKRRESLSSDDASAKVPLCGVVVEDDSPLQKKNCLSVASACVRASMRARRLIKLIKFMSGSSSLQSTPKKQTRKAILSPPPASHMCVIDFNGS